MDTTVTVSVPEHRIAELLCSAYEGGSHYWARQRDGKPSPYRFQDDDPSKPLELVPRFSVTIRDLEDGEKAWVLTPASLKRGLRVMATKYPRHWADFMAEHDDAETGDVFLQCALFGEVLYG